MLTHHLGVKPLARQIDAHPELWDQHPMRRDFPGSPFKNASDIWVRFLPPDRVAETGQPHFAEFYPCWKLFTALHPIVFSLMHRVRAVHLGGIMITKTPPGVTLAEHADKGWHPEFYNCKAHVAIRSNPDCISTCEDDRVSYKEGEAWTFDNLKRHSVINGGKTDRIVAIICMRVEQ